MLADLGMASLEQLSHMIHSDDAGKPKSTSWIQVYRELVEWATLYAILKKDFATDTLIVFDGLLRSKVFAKENFKDFMGLMQKAIENQYRENRRRDLLGRGSQA